MGNKTPLDEYFELDEEPCMQSCIKKCKAKHVHILKVLTDLVSQPRKMADNAFEYASKNNLIRTNEIHGESEAKLVLEDAFSHEQR